MGGKTSNSICIDNAIQVLLSNEFLIYAKLLDKVNTLRKSDPSINIQNISTLSPFAKEQISITINDNLKFYDYLVEKLNSNIYIKMKGNKASDLIDIGREKFKGIDVSSQCILLLEILNMLTNMKTTYDIKLLGFSTSRTKIALKVSTLDEFKIINQSITGLYSSEITIV